VGSEGREAMVWMNGRLLPAAEATVPFLTPALHYGVAAFEGIRSYATPRGPAVFRLRDHVKRLCQSARVLGFRELPYDAEAIEAAILETVAANELEDCYIRPLIWLAEGGWNLSLDGGRPSMGIAVWPWRDYLGPEAVHRGIRANISSFARLHPNVAMTKAKISGNYANSVLARTDSQRLGFEEAILLDPQGYVAECTGENIFIVADGRLRTPPTSAILPGITRDTLLWLARDAGLEAEESMLSRDDLYTADEVLVCGTAAEVMSVREIDFRVIGTGEPGPITLKLQTLYRDATRGQHPRAAAWLAFVPAASKSTTDVRAPL
jgi:branched-chain amino acid aminotransferase